jgi:ferrous iron transport protein B
MHCWSYRQTVCPPAALATIRAEIGWKWLGFELVFLLALGWTVCVVVYQLGSLLGFGG